MKVPPEPDRRELLVLRCQRGERAAWTELLTEWERPLFYYLQRLTSSDEDALSLLQEVWLRVIQGLGSLKQPERLAAWLYVIARRTWARRLAATLREPNSTELEAEMEPTVDDFEQDVDGEALHQALDRIPLRDREVLTLFYLDDLTLTEVAQVLGIPSGTVKSRLNHARGRLRAELQRSERSND